MSSEKPKRALFDSFAEVGKALGHGSRLEILEQLAQGERSVEGLADRAGLAVANASQHLRLMQRAGLLASRRDGKYVLYRHSDPSVLQLVAALGAIAGPADSVRDAVCQWVRSPALGISRCSSS